ncbi:MAG TPA: hypothetical protein VKA18_02495, partial [Alphaproteobacteria bacterium]|nr:hypothetical protein [Alphaproteobacteria bacterium]
QVTDRSIEGAKFLQSKASEMDRAAAIMRIADFRLESTPETASDPKPTVAAIQVFERRITELTVWFVH